MFSFSHVSHQPGSSGTFLIAWITRNGIFAFTPQQHLNFRDNSKGFGGEGGGVRERYDILQWSFKPKCSWNYFQKNAFDSAWSFECFLSFLRLLRKPTWLVLSEITFVTPPINLNGCHNFEFKGFVIRVSFILLGKERNLAFNSLPLYSTFMCDECRRNKMREKMLVEAY